MEASQAVVAELQHHLPPGLAILGKRSLRNSVAISVRIFSGVPTMQCGIGFIDRHGEGWQYAVCRICLKTSRVSSKLVIVGRMKLEDVTEKGHSSEAMEFAMPRRVRP